MIQSALLSKEKQYNRNKITISVVEFILGLLFLSLFVTLGYSLKLEGWLRQSLQHDYLVLILFVIILGTLESLLLFPLSFISGYVLEHRYELSNQTLGSWLWEKLKGVLVAAPLGLILLLIFYWVLRHFPQTWWLIMGTVMLLFSVVLAELAPVLIFPLFYKFKPLDDQDLADDVRKLCHQVGMQLEGVYQFNLSKSTKKGNAAFTGLGKTKRVLLGDTLLDNLKKPEILSVLAHELGHYKLKHMWKNILVSMLTTYLGLYLVALIYKQLYPSYGEHPWSVAALPLMAIILTLYQFVTTPVVNAYSRYNERQADDFARQLIGASEPLITGLQQLSQQNLADEDPHPLVELFFYSHPPIKKRLARLQ